MPRFEPPPSSDPAGGEVLTLAEVASFLRVPEDAVLDAVANEALSGQQLGGEWRFLKRAVVEWLRFGPHASRNARMFPPPWALEHPFWEELVEVLEKRVLSKVPAPEGPPAKRGSKQAVLKHFGVFQKDGDLEEQLATTRAQRPRAGG